MPARVPSLLADAEQRREALLAVPRKIDDAAARRRIARGPFQVREAVHHRSAQCAGEVVPRDVAIILDLSGSMKFESMPGVYVDASGATIIRDAVALSPTVLGRLKDAGVKEVWAYEPGFWDLVCEQFCGQGHYTMQGKVVVIENEEYKKKFETVKNDD